MDGLRAIYYKEIDVRTEIETHIFEETLRLFNLATAKGLAESIEPEVITDRFLYELRTNNAVFSAFKTHRMQNDIAAQLIDPVTGQLKSFDKWKLDIKGMTDHYVHSWLQTEYDTAVLRAHQAADWKHFLEEADVFPNLRWMQTTSIVPDPLHERYWSKKLTLPLNHPFWQEHRPGDRWNCKCSLEQTDDPVNAEALEGYTPPLPMPGLDNNPANDGKIFSDTHPYYTEAYPGADRAVESFLGINPGWIPAESLADAEAFATRFVKEIGLDRTFKGQVSYKGIDLKMANRINHTLAEAFERLEMPQIAGIKAIKGSSATGKKIFKSSETVAAYDPVQKGIYLNSDILGSPEKLDAYIKRSREAFEYVQKNIDKLPASKRAIAERYIKAGRELTDDSLEGMILHELGHHAQWNVVPTKLFNDLGDNWERVAARISGYAGTNKSEYIAESFVSWMRGEKLIDPRLKALFEGKLKDLPVDSLTPGGKNPLFAKPQARKLERSLKGMSADVSELSELTGKEFTDKLKYIIDTYKKDFRILDDEKDIFPAVNEKDIDYVPLMNVARKLRDKGYRVFIMPPLRGIKSADYILIRDNSSSLWELKSIHKNGSISSRLKASESQAKKVILNVSGQVSSNAVSHALKKHFDKNPDAIEALVYKGKKSIVVSRQWANKNSFYKEFNSQYNK